MGYFWLTTPKIHYVRLRELDRDEEREFEPERERARPVERRRRGGEALSVVLVGFSDCNLPVLVLDFFSSLVMPKKSKSHENIFGKNSQDFAMYSLAPA